MKVNKLVNIIRQLYRQKLTFTLLQ